MLATLGDLKEDQESCRDSGCQSVNLRSVSSRLTLQEMSLLGLHVAIDIGHRINWGIIKPSVLPLIGIHEAVGKCCCCRLQRTHSGCRERKAHTDVVGLDDKLGVRDVSCTISLR